MNDDRPEKLGAMLPDPEAQPRYREPAPAPLARRPNDGPEIVHVTWTGRPMWCAGAVYTDDHGRRVRERCDRPPGDIRRTRHDGERTITTVYEQHAGLCASCADIETRERENQAKVQEIRSSRGGRRDDA